MMEYGIAPAHDEIEVIIFGPGYGEAIAIHLGNSAWILIDSCINPASKKPAALHYMEKIGISPDCVRNIIASHWHDDHVKGLSELKKACPNAELVISSVFNDKESLAFLYAFGDVEGVKQTGGCKELYKSIIADDNPFFAGQRSIILEEEIGGKRVCVSAFSPTSAAQAASKLHMAQHIPTTSKDPINHAPELKPNIEAVVVHIEVGGDAILLGSDLENKTSLGWDAVCNDRWCSSKNKASFYKVAHHGSETGEYPDIWNLLLHPKPIAALTPFINGSVNLPKDSDKERINKQAGSAYTSSGASKKPTMDKEILKRLSDIAKNVSQVNTGFGAVRLRKKSNAKDWMVELFGNAQAL